MESRETTLSCLHKSLVDRADTQTYQPCWNRIQKNKVHKTMSHQGNFQLHMSQRRREMEMDSFPLVGARASPFPCPRTRKKAGSLGYSQREASASRPLVGARASPFPFLFHLGLDRQSDQGMDWSLDIVSASELDNRTDPTMDSSLEIVSALGLDRL